MTCRSSHRRFPVENGFLKNFANFTGKHLCWSVFLIKFVKTLLKRDSIQVFPCEICEILRTPTFEEHLPKTASIYEICSCSMLVSDIIFCIILQWTKKELMF